MKWSNFDYFLYIVIISSNWLLRLLSNIAGYVMLHIQLFYGGSGYDCRWRATVSVYPVGHFHHDQCDLRLNISPPFITHLRFIFDENATLSRQLWFNCHRKLPSTRSRCIDILRLKWLLSITHDKYDKPTPPIQSNWSNLPRFIQIDRWRPSEMIWLFNFTRLPEPEIISLQFRSSIFFFIWNC